MPAAVRNDWFTTRLTFWLVARARESHNQDRHAGKDRRTEHDDDDDDLPADADRGIPGVADEVSDHRVVDDALQAGDDVLQHRRPRKTPYVLGGWGLR